MLENKEKYNFERGNLMFNKVMLMGNICHDLELKTTPAGVSVLSFRIAVDRNYQVKGEERKADFFSVVCWRSTAEFVNKYFGKGRMIMVDGELQTRTYQDKNTNANVNVVEIVADSIHFTGEKSQQSGGGNATQAGGGYTPPPAQGQPPQQGGGYTPQVGQGGYNPGGGDFPPAGADDDDYPF
jgi:single-strand DNA-binding protein